MPRIILLPVSGTTADPEVFAMALTMARSFDSHLVALHVRPDVRRDIAALASSDGGMTAGIDTLLERMESDADTREKAASDAWHTFCTQNKILGADTPGNKGVTAEWASEVGVERPDNLGDVIYDENRIFGDGINIAASQSGKQPCFR